FTPLFAGLLLLSPLTGRWRDLWPWQLLCLLCLLANTWPPAYVFAIRHLGFYLSPFDPQRGATIPAFVVAAYAADHVLQRGLRQRLVACAVLLVPLAMSAWAVSGPLRPKVHTGYAVLAVALVLGTMAF